MTRTIGCYHAHYSNIDYIQQAMEPFDVELVHFVDPGFDRRKSDAAFPVETAQARIQDTLVWVESAHVDAILVTCTFFTAHMPDSDALPVSIPVVRIDDPLFEAICAEGRPPLLVFTNPATVDGTVRRLIQYAEGRGMELPVRTHLLEGTFDILMRGDKETYLSKVTEGLMNLAAEHPDHQLWAAQLSMAGAAGRAEEAAGVRIGDPLSELSRYMEKGLQLKPRPRTS
ncbi:hypothetical protein DVH26_32865 [Paenibacillus sp. H1-7]|uniref:aspartate/glutamate racemase family protein n=1 Tax=Paenibacillus sp. H1-7 TaxID=2282849 RepID=UPI001EF94A3E|nr:aspartate/glutamate racemase family protein [Paenibacillus sp. H1-7]ULL18810.1 hypothetical protein DVH26_32865 [Paenibacillus sp. H1-7]